ncbi:hypothetical protein E8E14_011079 [Neopestalotiopsis sp. 37M]|nr:hypothetical protein E8E14_011079 [Neopestalotiopsis sp. 37M]
MPPSSSILTTVVRAVDLADFLATLSRSDNDSSATRRGRGWQAGGHRRVEPCIWSWMSRRDRGAVYLPWHSGMDDDDEKATWSPQSCVCEICTTYGLDTVRGQHRSLRQIHD